MSVFQNQTASTAAAALDPNKHVKYSLGMVLGADDLEQEFAYVANLPQWLARETLGYGTVCGLKVSIEMDARGPRIAVEPGVALTPRGQLVRVTPTQCAYINDWLDAHREDVARQIGSPLATQISLYVILCYRACPTDSVPIPGEPCRDETESTVDSRWQDDFELKLSLTPPDQTEEDAIRDFVAWLNQIEITDEATSFASINEFLDALRNAAPQIDAALGSPLDFMYGSPLEEAHINTGDACEYLRAAFRLWVTELRPRWRGYERYTVKNGDHLAAIATRFDTTEAALTALNQVSEATLQVGMILKIPRMFCDGTPSDEECVLLAEVDVPLLNGLADAMSNDNVHEEGRPYLITLRLLQEWLTCGPRGTVIKPAEDVKSETSFGLAPSLGILTDQYALADHTHGTPALTGDVTIDPGDETHVGGDAIVGGIGHVPIDFSALDNGQVLMFDNTTAPTWRTTQLDGDARGPIDANKVEKIQNQAVSPNTPGQNQVLVFRDGQWQPLEFHGDVEGTIDNFKVTKIQGVKVDSTPPTTDGQVLTYDGTQWTPRGLPAGGTAPGDYLEHEPGLPQYFIEAAGIIPVVQSDDDPIDPSNFPAYNGLKAYDMGNGQLRVTFNTYANPDKENKLVYIIKAMPAFNDSFPSVTINFLKFDGNGIYLLITNAGKPVHSLTKLKFVIEVSKYFFSETEFPKSVSMRATRRSLVDLNTASVDELRTLPRIGPELAKRIIAARRRTSGGFQSLNDLLRVNGIGEDLLSVLEPFVTVSRP